MKLSKATSKKLVDLLAKLEALSSEITAAHESIAPIAEEAREQHDARSERWQEGEAGQENEEGVSQLEQIADELDTLATDLASPISTLTDLLNNAT